MYFFNKYLPCDDCGEIFLYFFLLAPDAEIDAAWVQLCTAAVSTVVPPPEAPPITSKNVLSAFRVARSTALTGQAKSGHGHSSYFSTIDDALNSGLCSHEGGLIHT